MAYNCSFNLVIENLLISTNRILDSIGAYQHICFNLVIENLLISTPQVVGANAAGLPTLFQSRNRESSNFNPALWEVLPDVL